MDLMIFPWRFQVATSAIALAIAGVPATALAEVPSSPAAFPHGAMESLQYATGVAKPEQPLPKSPLVKIGRASNGGGGGWDHLSLDFSVEPSSVPFEATMNAGGGSEGTREATTPSAALPPGALASQPTSPGHPNSEAIAQQWDDLELQFSLYDSGVETHRRGDRPSAISPIPEATSNAGTERWQRGSIAPSVADPLQANTDDPLATVLPERSRLLGQQIAASALATEGADVTKGPGNGLSACAWAVNRFALEPILGRKLGSNPNLVVSVRDDLIGSGLVEEVPQTQAQPGDIVVTAGPGRSQHIGIVVPKRSGRGVEALSTRGGVWGWRSDLNFEMRYHVPGRIYRLRDRGPLEPNRLPLAFPGGDRVASPWFSDRSGAV